MTNRPKLTDERQSKKNSKGVEKQQALTTQISLYSYVLH